MVFAFVFWVDYLAVQTINQLNLVEVFFTYFRVFSVLLYSYRIYWCFFLFFFLPAGREKQSSSNGKQPAEGQRRPHEALRRVVALQHHWRYASRDLRAVRQGMLWFGTVGLWLIWAFKWPLEEIQSHRHQTFSFSHCCVPTFCTTRLQALS